MHSVNFDKSWSKVLEYSGTTHGVNVINSSKEIADVLYFSVKDKKITIEAVSKLS